MTTGALNAATPVETPHLRTLPKQYVQPKPLYAQGGLNFIQLFNIRPNFHVFPRLRMTLGWAPAGLFAAWWAIPHSTWFVQTVLYGEKE